MSWFRRLTSRFASRASGLDEEIEAHLERLTTEQMKRGLAPEEARLAARREFGSVASVRERHRAQAGWQWVFDAREDIRHAVRMLWRTPALTATVVVTLGLGIGANTAIFSVLNGVVLKALPYDTAGRLVVLEESAPLSARPAVNVSVRELYDYREQTRAFDALVEYHQMTFDLLRRGAPDRVNVGVVSHDYFDVLGIAPLAGRTFRAADDVAGAEAVLVLGYQYWQQRFGGDPQIIGQVFEMNDRPHTVVGILPNVPEYPQKNDVYMPVSACPFRAAAEQLSLQNRRAFAALTVFGRLAAGVDVERAAADVATVAARFAAANPTNYRPGSGFRATVADVRGAMVRAARPLLTMLIGATGLVLLIACANVASLMVARLLRRDREFAVRTALGAGRGRLLRQLLTESSLLALLGSLLGIAVAGSSLSMLTAFVSRFTSRTEDVSIDAGVLAFTLGMSLVTGLAVGILPALAARRQPAASLRDGKSVGETPGRRRMQGALIVAQVAVSVVLLAGAVLLLTSAYRMRELDAGYRGERVVVAEAFGNFTKYAAPGSIVRFYESVVARLEADPGVAGVAISDAVPLRPAPQQASAVTLQIEGLQVDPSEPRPVVDRRIVTPAYFSMLEIPVVQGRVFSALDHAEAASVALVNRSMLNYWSGREVVGSRISIDNGQTWRQVVGVVADVRSAGLENATQPQVYVPMAQSPALAGLVLVHTNGDLATAAAAIHNAVQALDPEMPVENIQTLDEIRGEYLSRPQLTATLLLVFAAVALAVTLAGIAGVMALWVSHRLREFGVRLALGATRTQVLGVVMRRGLLLIASGLALGMFIAVALAGALEPYLFETSVTDVRALGATALLLLISGALACLSPAWRATRVAPVVALQSE